MNTPSSMASTIVEDIVGKEQKEGLGQTVDQFGASVEKKTEERIETLRDTFGDSVDEIAGPAMKEAKSFREEKNELLDPSMKVSNIVETDGAAGQADMITRKVTVDKEAMSPELEKEEEGYWNRVKKHEYVHKDDQATTMNMDNLTIIDHAGNLKKKKVGSLVEWHASTEANKPEDLTPDYKEMVKDGEEVAESLGPDGADMIKEALRSGDIQGLQMDIVDRQREEIIEALSKDGELQQTAA